MHFDGAVGISQMRDESIIYIFAPPLRFLIWAFSDKRAFTSQLWTI